MGFAERLKELRKNAGLTQEELANAVGVTKRTIIHYELGQGKPKTTEIVVGLAKFFNVPIDYIMSIQDEFIVSARGKYGSRGRRDAETLVKEVGGLFAGGALAEEDKDAVMKAIQEAYWIAKEENKKYAPKKQRKTGGG
jgi:transcriptional regulator with XRE-family HTH domain